MKISITLLNEIKCYKKNFNSYFADQYMVVSLWIPEPTTTSEFKLNQRTKEMLFTQISNLPQKAAGTFPRVGLISTMQMQMVS